MDQQIAMAQLADATQRRGQDIGLQTQGSYGDRAQTQRDIAGMQMNPANMAAQLQQQQYDDRRSDTSLQRDIQQAMRPQIMGALQGGQQEPMGLEQALAFASGGFGDYMSGQRQAQEAERQRELERQVALAQLAQSMGAEGSDLANMLAGTLGADAETSAMIGKYADRKDLEEELQSATLGRQLGGLSRQAQSAKSSIPWLDIIPGMGGGRESYMNQQTEINQQLMTMAQALAESTGGDAEEIYTRLRQQLAERIQPTEGIGQTAVEFLGGYNPGAEMKRAYGEM